MAFLDAQSSTVLFDPPDVYEEALARYALSAEDIAFAKAHRRSHNRLKANDSLECRNCHSAVAMDFTKQTQRAADIHSKYLLTGKATCIDCHKGIAHELPNMEGVEPGWKMPKDLEGQELPAASNDAIGDLRKAVASAHGSMMF